jgi:RNA-binding protein NOB1
MGFANISISGFSPFVMRDINSKSAMLGIRGTDVKSMMRRNPNDGRNKGKKKK